MGLFNRNDKKYMICPSCNQKKMYETEEYSDSIVEMNGMKYKVGYNIKYCENCHAQSKNKVLLKL